MVGAACCWELGQWHTMGAIVCMGCSLLACPVLLLSTTRVAHIGLVQGVRACVVAVCAGRSGASAHLL
jgi:hypothetical protein